MEASRIPSAAAYELIRAMTLEDFEVVEIFAREASPALRDAVATHLFSVLEGQVGQIAEMIARPMDEVHRTVSAVAAMDDQTTDTRDLIRARLTAQMHDDVAAARALKPALAAVDPTELIGELAGQISGYAQWISRNSTLTLEEAVAQIGEALGVDQDPGTGR